MLEPDEIHSIAADYDLGALSLGVIASHSALDICDGARDEGLAATAYCQRGRHRTYDVYFKRRTLGSIQRGFVDRTVVMDRFDEVLIEERQNEMRAENCVFVPNRSFTSYCDMKAIEDDFRVPMFGSRAMLRSEERGEQRDYYWMLEQAGMPFPEPITDPAEIDALTIVKLHHAEKKLERGFFTCTSHDEFRTKSKQLIADGVIRAEDLGEARIERYVIGPVFNFDFFYSPLLAEEGGGGLELLGVDWRFETSLDGHVRLPAPQQMSMPAHQLIPEYTVCGHNLATVRESLLEKVFELGEQFVDFANKTYPGGIIGPFCLQTCVDKDLDFYIYDVAPRVGGGTNVHVATGHPYGNSLWRRPMSSGRRIALEVKMAAEQERLADILT